MLNPIKEIAKWQKDAGNTAKPYDDFLESSFQIEEALEGFNVDSYIVCDGKESAKDLARSIVKQCITEVPLSDVDRLDKACDAIVFAIGSMTKLGLDHHAITKALIIVNDANKQKLNSKRDSLGKLEKPLNFKGPEEKLQELLDSIRK